VSAATTAATPSPLVRRRSRRIPWSALSTAAIMVALGAADVIIQPNLLNLFQIGLLLQTALPLVFVAAAQTLVVLVRGIDLSVGGVLVVANGLTVVTVGGAGGDHQLLLILVLVVGLAAGALNGVLVGVLGLQPFIATLGTWTIFNGIALTVLPTDGGTPPPWLINFTLGAVGGVPNTLIILVGVVVVWRILCATKLGIRIRAVGADEDRASLNGTSVLAVKLIVYSLAGLCAALAGILLAGATSTGTPTAGDAYILTSVAAVVIGGTSLVGRGGGVGLTVMAAMALTFISDIVNAENFSVWVSVAASSGLLLVVVVLRGVVEQVVERRHA
jgi:ribose transport system permease protein